MTRERTATNNEIDTAKTWLNSYCTSRDVVIAYHADPDGVVAATFMDHYLCNRLDSRVKTIAVRTHEFDFSKLRQQLTNKSFDSLVAVDINFASRPGFLDWLANDLSKPVLIYDDHLVRDQPGGPLGFRYINPMVNRTPLLPVPACLFVYLLWSGKRDADLDGAKLSDLIEVGLFGESVLPEYTRTLRLRSGPINLIKDAARAIYTLYSIIDWPTECDPVIMKLRALLGANANSDEIARGLKGIDRARGGISRKLDAAVGFATDQIIKTGSRHRIPDGGEVLVGRAPTSEYLMANLVASNVRRRLDSGVAIVYQQLADRTIVELRRTRDLETVDLDSVVEQVAHFDGVINSGGHPPAAGLAVESDKIDSMLAALKLKIIGG